MTCRLGKFVTLLVVAGLSQAAVTTTAWAEPELLLIAHGSSRPEWNKPVMDFGQKVAVAAKKAGRFKAVRTALLEAAEPAVPTALAELEAEGCDRIIAVPLFIAPTGHTHFDVPAVLGIYSSPKTNAAIADEGGKVAKPRVPVVLTETLAASQLLPRFALDQVRKLSKGPKDEAVVILAHGDPDHHLLIDRLMRQVTTYCCGQAGIDYGDWAFIRVGQDYPTTGMRAINTARQNKKRVLVIGLYVSSSASKIHQRHLSMMRKKNPDYDPFSQKEVVFSGGSLVNHPELVRWVLDAAQGALTPLPGQKNQAKTGKVN